jgi:hypothetical protein
MVDGKLLHGGLADRLYGIINAFAVCKIKNVPFKLHFVFPFDIRTFLIPNNYDWSIEKEDISYNILYSKVMVRIQEEGWFNEIKFNKQVHFYCNTKRLDSINECFGTNYTYNELFNELFKPSDSFQIKINNITNSILGNPYVGMHFRFRNSLGDFPERSHSALPEPDKVKLLNLTCHAIESYVISGNKIFITADSQFFLNYISHRFPNVYFIPGETILMDFEAPLSVHEKSFLDFFLLGYANKIVSLYGQGLYLSGFSAFASQILNTEFESIRIDSIVSI